ncbi:MAG: NAD(P)H-dependent oxidoreductase subunit E, partial [Actinomycetia bacterium]|nr:NAD(P)H-dependent oxidoreductase subunit E [Actinomycetes bacterium]
MSTSSHSMLGIRSQGPQSSRQRPCGSNRFLETEGIIDYATTTDEPTAAERAAVDSVLGVPASVYAGATERSRLDDHVAFGGFHRTQERRTLLLPTLHAVQSTIGWVSHGALNYIAMSLPVSPAEAYGVATFYDLISTEERPPRVAHLCDDIACKARGVDDTLADLSEQFGEAGTTIDGGMWRRSPCLGQCDKGSAAYVQVAGGDDVVIAPVTVEQVIDILSVDKPSSAVDPTPTTQGATLLGTTASSLDEFRSGGGYDALTRAISIGPAGIVAEVEASKLRGRGGAAFPAGIKWSAVAAESGRKYVICNADESEPGTFKDRVLMEANPFGLIEALTIAAYGVGAEEGYIYIRGEYPTAYDALSGALVEARAAGFLGVDVAGAGFTFDIELRKGAGAYICGEETALFNSIEGFRGEPRQKPPFPTQAGVFGLPTLVNNVESLMNIPSIVLDGGEAFAAIGTAESTGPKLFCVSGNVHDPGVYEVAFGATTRDLVHLAGGVEGEVAGVLIGGAAGSFITADDFDLPLTFEDTRSHGIGLGSGVVLVFNTENDLCNIVQRIAHFFAEESCGVCVPCRAGTVRQEETLLRIGSGSENLEQELELLADLDNVLRDASICGLG